MAEKKRVRVVLAEGEVTGHAHVAEGVDLEWADEVLGVPDVATITHEEHGTRVIPKGDFDVRKVVELDAAGDTREVLD